MNLKFMLDSLYDKDTSKSFEVLKKLEQLSEKSNMLYPHINQFIDMVKSEQYVIRVRGFRLFCKQAKWDNDNIINENIQTVLSILHDDKPTAVRQALATLKDVVFYKKELRELIEDKVLEIDYLRYKDTMHKLIVNDIQNLLSTRDKE